MTHLLLVSDGTLDIVVERSSFQDEGAVFVQLTESGLFPATVAAFLTREEAREVAAALLDIANHASTPEEIAR